MGPADPCKKRCLDASGEDLHAITLWELFICLELELGLDHLGKVPIRPRPRLPLAARLEPLENATLEAKEELQLALCQTEQRARKALPVFGSRALGFPPHVCFSYQARSSRRG